MSTVTVTCAACGVHIQAPAAQIHQVGPGARWRHRDAEECRAVVERLRARVVALEAKP